MSLKIITPALIVSSILLFSAETCNEKTRDQKKQTPPATSQQPLVTSNQPPATDQLMIIFEKTSCYGRCPAFKVKIYGDGKVSYQGIRFVDSVGFYTATISINAITEIVTKATQIGFFEMKDNYDSNITDVPSTITGIKRKDSDLMKTVVDRAEAPAILKELEQLMDQKIKEFKLIKVKK